MCLFEIPYDNEGMEGWQNMALYRKKLISITCLQQTFEFSDVFYKQDI